MEGHDQSRFGADDMESPSSSSSSANHKLLTIANLIDTLAKEKIEEQTKHREQELVEQKRLVALYSARCQKLEETVQSLEQEKQNRGQESQTVENLTNKLDISEGRCQLWESEYNNLFAKHQKLRESLAYFATTLQESAITNVPTTDVTPSSGTLAGLSARVNKKLEIMESSRNDLHDTLRQNSHLVSSLAAKLKVNNRVNKPANPVIIPNILKGPKCRACGKRLSSWKKLQEHRITVHTVQNCKKFLRKKRTTAELKLTIKKTWGNASWNIAPPSPDENDADTTLCREEEQRSSTFLGTPDISNISLHQGDETREGYFCRCGFNGYSTSILEAHILYHTTERKFTCEICQLAFRRKKEERCHALLEHKIGTGARSISTWECGQCEMSFRNRSKLMKHQRTDHRADQPENSTTSKTQTPPKSKTDVRARRGPQKLRKKDLTHAVDMNLASQGFFCTCGVKSTNRYSQIRHIQRYNPRTLFQCSMCKKSYAAYHELKRHMRTKHRVERSGMGCHNCGEIYANRTDLMMHQEVAGCRTPIRKQKIKYASERKVTKTADPETVSAASRKKSGVHSHSEKGKFRCYLCRCNFVFLSWLRRHLQTAHNKENVRSKGKRGCSLCGQKFNSLKLLREHRRLCHANTPSAFRLRKSPPKQPKLKSLNANLESSKANLKEDSNASLPSSIRNISGAARFFVATQKHQMDRSKRHGFYCRCGSRHSTHMTLQAHIRYFTKEQKFACHICPKKYGYQCHLRQHLKSHHKIQKLQKNGEGAQVEESKSAEEGSASVPISNVATPPSPPGSKDDLKPICSSVPCSIEYLITGHAPKYCEDTNQLACECGLGFGNKDTLNSHTRFYALHKAFPCSCCPEVFSSFRDINAHVREIHNAEPDSNLIGCPSCGVIFADKHEYRRHMIMIA